VANPSPNPISHRRYSMIFCLLILLGVLTMMVLS